MRYNYNTLIRKTTSTIHSPLARGISSANYGAQRGLYSYSRSLVGKPAGSTTGVVSSLRGMTVRRPRYCCYASPPFPDLHIDIHYLFVSY